MGAADEGQLWKRLMASPWPWLGYLPLYAIPWFFTRPTQLQLWGSAAGIALFLAIYLWGNRQSGRRRILATFAVLATGFALAWAGNWTVIATYAAALAGSVRPGRLATRLVAATAILTLLFALAIGTLWPWGAFAAFFMVMVGLATASGAALQDKNAALAAAQDEVQRLAATAERERIGRDLHDLLGRSLTFIAIQAELAAKLTPRDPDKAEAEMRAVAQTARQALGEVRAAVAGMTQASLAREVEQSRAALEAAGIACTVEGDAAAVEGGAGAVLAMALREAVTNTIRHSGAGRCLIAIVKTGDGADLWVEDNGDGTGLREGGGIGGIRARLSAAGGRLSVEAGQSGTRLHASLPFAPAGAA